MLGNHSVPTLPWLMALALSFGCSNQAPEVPAAEGAVVDLKPVRIVYYAMPG